MSHEEFERARAAGEFLESAQFVGNWYGTPARWVRDELERGHWVLLEIEVQGGLQVQAAHPHCIMIFLKTSSLHEYARRLRQRGTNTEADIQLRLQRAQQELKTAECYEFHVVNDDIHRAVTEIEAILDRFGGTPQCIEN
jgi:guanylate kinase